MKLSQRVSLYVVRRQSNIPLKCEASLKDKIKVRKAKAEAETVKAKEPEAEPQTMESVSEQPREKEPIPCDSVQPANLTDNNELPL